MYELSAIKDYIKEVISESTGSSVFDDTLLFDEEILDSMNILYLIGEMEAHFDVELSPDEVTEENYGTVQSIAEYILSKF